MRQPLDEEQGPRLVFADGTQSIYLADMSGDGLTDLVRIRNGEVCYWPNLGYGRFGAKVTMDNAPWFDAPDQFDQRRIRLADIDGSGTTDIIYLGRDGVRLYFNQSGNGWSDARSAGRLPARRQRRRRCTVVDLLGNGTACLVWSSPLPGDARQPDALHRPDGRAEAAPAGQDRSTTSARRPRVDYAPSTKFYLAGQARRHALDHAAAVPGACASSGSRRYDRISRNRFVTRYAYHHGYFDGVEREFRGFGMVEQWDTEEFAALSAERPSPARPIIDDVLARAAGAHQDLVPHRRLPRPRSRLELLRRAARREGRGRVLPRTGPDRCRSASAAARRHRPAGRLDARRRARSLPRAEGLDAAPGGLRARRTRTKEAASLHRHRAELHDPAAAAAKPATVTRCSSPMPREAISYHYERNPADPRIGHALTLEVDDFGNVLQVRRHRLRPTPARSRLWHREDQDKQTADA